MTPNDVLNYQIADRMPLYFLWRAVWKLFYDRDNCKFGHQSKIEEEITKWNSIVKYQKKIVFEKYGPQPEIDNKPLGTKGTFVDEMEFQLCRMCQVLVYGETGEWQGEDDHKPFSLETVLRHSLDYRKLPMCVTVFPESITKEGIERGQQALKKNMEDQPELYSGEAANDY